MNILIVLKGKWYEIIIGMVVRYEVVIVSKYVLNLGFL